MTLRDPYADDRQPICPACGVTMHPLLDEQVTADECRECGFQVDWTAPDAARSDDDRGYRDRWADES